MSGITYGQEADKSFVSRRRSKFAGHTPRAVVALSSDFDPYSIVNADGADAEFAPPQGRNDWA